MRGKTDPLPPYLSDFALHGRNDGWGDLTVLFLRNSPNAKRKRNRGLKNNFKVLGLNSNKAFIDLWRNKFGRGRCKISFGLWVFWAIRYTNEVLSWITDPGVQKRGLSRGYEFESRHMVFKAVRQEEIVKIKVLKICPRTECCATPHLKMRKNQIHMKD